MTSSRELVLLDSCFDLFQVEASVFGCGSDPEFADGPSDNRHAVRFAWQELGRRFHDEWAATL